MVALACSWAPHNLGEVAAAINSYLNGEEPSLPGPDFPTGGIILNKDDIPKIMATGKGTVKIRAKYRIENNSITFYELPYGVNTEELIEQLHSLAEAEKLEGVTEIRDDSDKTNVQVTLECAKTANLGKIISAVYQGTNAQSSFSYNQVALVEKQPVLLNLKDCIRIYVEHNVQCIINEHTFELQKVTARLEIVEGLLKALEDIDNIISLIKSSESAATAKTNLMEKYFFTEPQARAIVDMKLGRLAGLEKMEVQTEHKELVEKSAVLSNIISSRESQISILRKRLAEIVRVYGDSRRTELTQTIEEKKSKEAAAVIPEDCVVVISSGHTIKRIPKKNFKTQRRNTKGMKLSEAVLFSYSTNTQDTLMIFTTKGKMYRLLIDNLPEGSNSSIGTPVSALVKLEDDEVPVAYTTAQKDDTSQYIFFATKRGLIKRVPLQEYSKMRRTGIVTINLKDGDELADTAFINEEEIMLVTKKGMCIRFATSEMPISSRIAQGVKGINLADGDYVVAALPIRDNDEYLAVVTENNYGKKVELSNFPLQNRGGKGLTCGKGVIVGGVLIIKNEDKILVNGDKTAVVIEATDFPVLGRVSQGNIILKDNTIILSISQV